MFRPLVRAPLGMQSPETYIWDPLPLTISLQSQKFQTFSWQNLDKGHYKSSSHVCPWSLATSISHSGPLIGLLTDCAASMLALQATRSHKQLPQMSSVNQIIPVPCSDLSKDCPSKANKIPNSPLASPKPSTSFPLTNLQCVSSSLSHFP